MTSQKPLLELNSNKLMLIFSKRLLNHSSSPLKVLILKRQKSMKSFWSEAQLEFQKLDSWSNSFSMEKNQTQVSILMRLFAMVLPFKVVSSADKTLEMEELLLLMLLLSHLVFKLSAVSWARLFQKVHTSQLRNHKFSQPIKIIKKLSQFKYLKVRDPWQKITTY